MNLSKQGNSQVSRRADRRRAARQPVRRARPLLWRLGPVVLRLERRVVGLAAVLLAVMVALTIIGLMIGDYPLAVPDVVAALLGRADDPLGQYFVRDIRLPRVLLALMVGAALGSPDIIGFTTGAATGALLQIILFEAGPAQVAIGALLGGFGTALVVYLLAWRSGLSGYRLVLVGIGVSAVLSALNSLLVVRASLTAAQTAAQWLAGSLNAASWVQVTMLGVTVVLLVPAALMLSRPLGIMTMGDDLATGLGVRVERTRLLVVATGIALVSIATAATGPIAFVALAAPHIAKKLSRSARVGAGSAALMGAALVGAADLIAQRVFAPTQLPVGVVTGTLGGLYLIWLLSSEWRKQAS